MTDDEHIVLQETMQRYVMDHPESSPSERMAVMLRLYEKFHFGITSRDLARGYEIEFKELDDGRIVKCTNRLKGHFRVGGDGNNDASEMPVALYRKASMHDVSKPMTRVEFMRNKKQLREFNLAAEEHTTGTDIQGAGEALLEHGGIDTGYGASAGVINPQYMDYMLRVTSEQSIFKNFARMVPMPSMAFYFPMKVTKPSDDTSAFGPTLAPTAEGRAGLDYATSFLSYHVNGWKWLRHAALTKEVILLLRQFIDVKMEYLNDLTTGMGLLWDYVISRGLISMLTTAKWRRYETGGGTWSDEEYVPLAGAAGANILGANAKYNYLFQDLTPASAQYGLIYEPHATTSMQYLTSTLRAGSASGDDFWEFVVALASIAKQKGSKLEYLCIPPAITEFLARDSRFTDNTIRTGNIRFQNENGYLGTINVGGTNQLVDLWEYDTALQGDIDSSDAPVEKLTPCFGGRYNQAWNQGIYSPFYFRVDDGKEVVQRGTGNVNVLRDNETRVITVGSMGSSFPGDYHHVVIGFVALQQAHG